MASDRLKSDLSKARDVLLAAIESKDCPAYALDKLVARLHSVNEELDRFDDDDEGRKDPLDELERRRREREAEAS